jgi:BirA family biotin operon repressor/biotin-[acetyl-CoA-carboxylase] ligase
MNEKSLQRKLSGLPLGKIRYFDSIGSTNDEALAWAAAGTPDLSFVIADEQTSGRGRLNRKWFTSKGTALAFSLVLRSPAPSLLSRTVGLAALSIADSLLKHRLAARIKWPNDILLDGKKVAGILIETVWTGAEIDSLVVGMGINMRKESVPPPGFLQFPATSVEAELGHALDREEFLHDLLSAFIARRQVMDTDGFMRSWEDLLAFRGEQVQVMTNEHNSLTGELLGIDSEGGLRLRGEHGHVVTARVGEVSLRPLAC